jgi:hypothetical protein
MDVIGVRIYSETSMLRRTISLASTNSAPAVADGVRAGPGLSTTALWGSHRKAGPARCQKLIAFAAPACVQQAELIMGNNVVMAPRRSPHVDQRKMVIVADKKRPFVDWEAALAGIAGGNTVPEYAQTAISSASRRRLLWP